MVPQALFLGAFGFFAWGDFLTGRLAGTNVNTVYEYGFLVASLSVVLAALLCLSSGVFLMFALYRIGSRAPTAGTLLYWIYIASHLVSISALGELRHEFTLLDAVDYPIGALAVLVTYSTYRWSVREYAADDSAQSILSGRNF
jgi:hypothetical protein